jgi:hypothetical protein
MCISAETGQQEQAELLAFLDKNSEVFAWSTSDLVGVSRDIIEHRLHVNPSAKPKKTEAPQNVRRENRRSEGRGSETVGRRFHLRGGLSPVVSKCCDG